MLTHTNTPWLRSLSYDQGAFQVIYTTKAPGPVDRQLDYCRETAPLSVQTVEAAIAWAQSHFERVADAHARANVTAFYLDRF